LTDPVALDYIFNKHPYDYPKQKDIARVLAGLAGPGILVANGEAHKRQRFAMQKGFSANSVKALYPFFQHHARHLRDRLLDRIKSEEKDGMGVKTDMYRPLHKTTLDVLGHAAFGHSFNALDEPGLLGQVSYTEGVVASVSTNPLARAFDELLKASVQAQGSWTNRFWDVSTMFIPWLAYLPVGVEANPEKKRARKVMDAEANKVIQRAIEDQKDAPHDRQRSDIMSSLLRANANSSNNKEDGEENSSGRSKMSSKASLSDEELLAQITSLQLAGHESTGAQIVSRPSPNGCCGPNLLTRSSCHHRPGSSTVWPPTRKRNLGCEERFATSGLVWVCWSCPTHGLKTWWKMKASWTS
jgi:cytochrome P450